MCFRLVANSPLLGPHHSQRSSMAEAWTHVYQVPNYPPETGLQGSIPRGTCSKCGCLRFISELVSAQVASLEGCILTANSQGQSSRCICPHQWHHHQPQWLTGGVDEIPTAVAMSVYRAGRHQTNDCVGYFPVRFISLGSDC